MQFIFMFPLKNLKNLVYNIFNKNVTMQAIQALEEGIISGDKAKSFWVPTWRLGRVISIIITLYSTVDFKTLDCMVPLEANFLA